MRISVLTIGAIASILSLNAYASSVVTSQTYVDNQDALKVDIAQGVGTNNANVGKTLVVNSQGNLELGTVSADNFVEDSITDGVTNKAPSENAVHDALANKQDTIEANTMEFSAWGDDFEIPTVVSYETTNGLVGDEYGIVNNEIANTISDNDGLWGFRDSAEVLNTAITDKMIPTVRAVANETGAIWDNMNNWLQNRVPKSGYAYLNGSGVSNAYREGSGTSTDDYLNISVKGTGIATRTDVDGRVGERKIIEESDVPNYQASNLTANQKAIQKISIPTMGAVMAAIGANGLPSGTNNQVLQYTNGAWTSVTMDSAPTASSNKPVTSGGVYTAISGKQNKMTCTQWVDNAAHTDANCLLWSMAN